MQYDALELFDYGNVRPLSPSLSPSHRSPSPALLSLQRIVEDDVSGGSNAPVGAVYRGQGRQLRGRAIQSIVGGGGGGGRASVCCTIKHANYKRWGQDRSSDVRTSFEGDPTRPSHPLCVETKNKLVDCMLKIRCRICRSLISYHNSSWTCATTHIRSHNIVTAQDIAAAAALASESEANGEVFPIHKLPTPPQVKREAAGDAALMRRTFAAPSYGTDTQPYHWIKQTIVKWIAADCLPYRTVETATFRVMTRNLDPKCPNFGRKALPPRWDTTTSTVQHFQDFLTCFFHHCSSISMHRKVEVVACRTLKIIIMFTATVLVHVTKPVCQIDFYSLLANHLV